MHCRLPQCLFFYIHYHWGGSKVEDVQILTSFLLLSLHVTWTKACQKKWPIVLVTRVLFSVFLPCSGFVGQLHSRLISDSFWGASQCYSWIQIPFCCSIYLPACKMYFFITNTPAWHFCVAAVDDYNKAWQKGRKVKLPDCSWEWNGNCQVHLFFFFFFADKRTKCNVDTYSAL